MPKKERATFDKLEEFLAENDNRCTSVYIICICWSERQLCVHIYWHIVKGSCVLIPLCSIECGSTEGSV